MEKKCHCDGTRGTDCYWCQGTGYKIDPLKLGGTKETQTKKVTSQVQDEHLSVLNQMKIAENIIKIRQETKAKKYKENISKQDQAHNVAKSEAKYTTCVKCGVNLKITKLGTHERKCKAKDNISRKIQKTITAIRKIESTAVTEITVCENCGFKLSKNKLELHMTKCKALSNIKKNEPEKISIGIATKDALQKLKSNLINCENCGAAISVKNLNKHKTRCRSIKKNSPEKIEKTQPKTWHKKRFKRINHQ